MITNQYLLRFIHNSSLTYGTCDGTGNGEVAGDLDYYSR
jgi:hypothetical protein